MIKNNPEAAKNFAQNSMYYDARVDAGLKVLAKACKQSTNTEVQRLRRMRELFGGKYQYPNVEELKKYQGHLPLPVIFEFILGLAAGKLRGYGYRTVGCNKSPELTHSQWLALLLQGAAKLLLENNGQPKDVKTLGELARLSYPRPEELANYEQNVTMMLVGLVPKAEHARLQVFFNPRMGDPTGYDRQLDAMLRCVECDPPNFARHMYDYVYQDGVSLYGVGVEFDPQAPPRTLIYFLFDRAQTADMINGLSRLFTFAGAAGEQEIQRATTSLDTAISTLGEKFIKSQIELAIILQQEKLPQLKYSVMLHERDTLTALTRIVQSQHCSMREIKDLVKAVSRRTTKAVVISEAIHSVALQLFADKPARIDITCNVPL
ncbi:MAG: hypothetical protein JW841_04560 [Deltaproteobacteria bacterium]|nr:hypothetical protein [Deltaproteobacteria bacterium]